MDQYISQANQEILWKTFHTIPDIQILSAEQQLDLFRSTVHTIYETNRIQRKKHDLLTLNKQTLNIIIEQVRLYCNRNPIALQPHLPPSQPQQQHPQPIPYFETAEDRMKRIFEEKQKQYDQMTTKPNVPKPSELFQEPVDNQDGAIENMDELIKQYQEQRDRDIMNIPKPVSTIEESIMDIDLQKIMQYIKQLEKRVIVLENQIRPPPMP
jgi:hypothetical protein